MPVSNIADRAGGGKSCDLAAGGSLYWSPATGAQLVHGAIKGRWLQLGGPGSWLGYPITDETAAVGGGFYNDFRNDATIAWTQATGARIVQGLIRAKWRQLGSPAGPVGYPSSDEGPAPGGGRVSEFGAGGSITWSASATADAKRALGSSGASLGPLSIGDATTEVQGDGTTCYRRGGLQVVALFCSPLPVLPPNDAPPAAAQASSTHTGSLK